MNSQPKTPFLFVLSLMLGLALYFFLPGYLSLQLKTEQAGHLQIFYNYGNGYNEDDSFVVDIDSLNTFVSYDIRVPRVSSLKSIRIDPMDRQGKFELKTVVLSLLHFKYELIVEGTNLNQIEIIDKVGNNFFGNSIGNDPNIYFNSFGAIILAQKAFAVIIAVFFVLIVVILNRFRIGISNVLVKAKNLLTQIFNRDYAILLLLIGGSIFIRAIFLFNSRLSIHPHLLHTVWPDEATYFQVAEYIAKNGILNYLRSEYSVIVSPGNPLYLWFLYGVTGSVLYVRIFNLFLSALSVYLVFEIGKKLFNRDTGFLAACLCSINGAFIIYSPTLLTEPPFIFFLCLLIFCFLKTFESYGEKSTFITQALICFSLGAAALLKPIFQILPFCALVVFIIIDLKRKKMGFYHTKRILPSVLIIIFVLAAVGYKNYYYFEKFFISTGSGAALWLGSRPDTEGDEPPYRKLSYDTDKVTKGMSHLSIEGDALLRQEAVANIKDHFFDYMFWNLKKVGRLTVGSKLAWFFPYHNFEQWREGVKRTSFEVINIVFQIMLVLAIMGFGCIGLVKNFSLDKKLLIFSIIIYYFVLSIPFLVNQRYGLPFMLLMTIIASKEILSHVSKRQRSHYGKIFYLLFIIAGGLYFLC